MCGPNNSIAAKLNLVLIHSHLSLLFVRIKEFINTQFISHPLLFRFGDSMKRKQENKKKIEK